MKGSMQVMYAGDQPQLLEQLIRDKIQMIMTSPSMIVGDIRAVTFVESKTNPATPTAQNNSVSSVGMAVSIAAGFLAMAMIGVFMAMALLRRKRRRVVHKGHADYDQSEQIPDLEQLHTTSSDSSERKAKNPVQTEYGEEPWEPLQPPMDVEYNGVVVPVLTPDVTVASTSSIYLASTRPRKRKKGVVKKKKSLRERVSLAPFGIEPIPEAEGDFHSALYDIESPDSDGSSEEDDDVQLTGGESPPRTNLPNASPPLSPHIFQADSSSPDSANSNYKKERMNVRPLPPPWV
jgi:hypothetical protein